MPEISDFIVIRAVLALFVVIIHALISLRTRPLTVGRHFNPDKYDLPLASLAISYSPHVTSGWRREPRSHNEGSRQRAR